MKTQLLLGPGDHGRAASADDLAEARYQGGYQYEIIDGRLYVSPAADLPQEENVNWLVSRLMGYAASHPTVINRVYTKARVFVPDRSELTVPEPDLPAYLLVDDPESAEDFTWENISPLLVGEVISPGDPQKDLEGNKELYLQVPSIREYWVLDPRPDFRHPQLYVYRRRGQRWQNRIGIPFGDEYTTRLLPGFRLVVDPRQR